MINIEPVLSHFKTFILIIKYLWKISNKKSRQEYIDINSLGFRYEKFQKADYFEIGGEIVEKGLLCIGVDNVTQTGEVFNFALWLL